MCKIFNCGCDLHFHLHAEALLTQVFIPWSIYPSMLENCMRIFHWHPKINMCKTKLIFFSPHSSSFQKTDLTSFMDLILTSSTGLPLWIKWKRACLQWRRPRFDPWIRKVPWRKEWTLTPVFLPGEFHGHRSLVGYSPWGCKESDTTSD